MAGAAGSAYAQPPSDAAKAQPAAQPSATAGASAPAAAAATAPASAAGTPTAPAAAPAFEMHFVDAPPPKAPADVPSADILKKARDAGYHTKVSHNVVYYCREDTDVGTRFRTEKCLTEEQLQVQLERLQAAKDQLRNNPCGGSGCSGK